MNAIEKFRSDLKTILTNDKVKLDLLLRCAETIRDNAMRKCVERATKIISESEDLCNIDPSLSDMLMTMFCHKYDCMENQRLVMDLLVYDELVKSLQELRPFTTTTGPSEGDTHHEC